MPKLKNNSRLDALVSDKETKGVQHIIISPPRFSALEVVVTGNVPYVQNRFSHKAQMAMREKQERGSTAIKGKKREPKNFQECYENSLHRSKEGWYGIPAPGIRKSLVRACKLCGFEMTLGKLCLFVEHDGLDVHDSTPLVRIVKGEPHYFESMVRLNGIRNPFDVHARAMWDAGWQTKLRVRYDADIFTASDVYNLICRVGIQIGWGEGRPDSKDSTGMGWGTFDVSEETFIEG